MKIMADYLSSQIHIGNSIIQLENINGTIIISSKAEKQEINIATFFQIAAVFLHASKELEYVEICYPHTSLVLRNDVIDSISITISYNGGDEIEIVNSNYKVHINRKQFIVLTNDICDVLNSLVDWSDFDVRNYDPAFLNVMLAKELPYIYGEKIINMYLGDLLVPHVPYQANGPETVRLEECVRVNSLRGKVDIDSFKRRVSNHYNQSNSMRLKSILNMIIANGYPYNNEYITIYSTNNLVVDGWHRAACLYYLYGNINVPIKVIMLRKK